MKTLTYISFFLALGVSCLLLVVPTYTGETHSSDGTVSVAHATLLQVNGPWTLVSLAIPAWIALVPLLFPRRSLCICAAVVLLAFAVLGSFTIGLFYLPSAAAMIGASLMNLRTA